MHKAYALLPWTIGMVVALTLAGVGLWAHGELRPPSEEQRLEVGYGWMFWVVVGTGTVMCVALRLLWPDRQGWLMAGAMASLLLAGMWGAIYVWSWMNYTLWISPHGNMSPAADAVDEAGFRVFRSHAYTEAVAAQWNDERQAGQPLTSVDDLLHSAAFKAEDIFADRSRDSLPLLVLGSWTAMCLALVATSQFLTRLVEHALCQEEPALAALQVRLRPDRELLPAQFADKLDNAIATLAKAENIPGTIVSVAGLFAGRFGLLALLMSQHQEAAEQRMAQWNDKETKDLRRKYQTQGYEKLDFLEQIEIVRLAGIVPPTIATDLHWIRMRGNEARHANAPSMPRARRARALEFAVDIACWYAGQRKPDKA